MRRQRWFIAGCVVVREGHGRWNGALERSVVGWRRRGARDKGGRK